MEASKNRILIELKNIYNEPVPGVIITKQNDSNIRALNLCIDGPPGSPYEGGKFYVEVFLPASYPIKAPKCRFLTPIYHPNINQIGQICLDILKDKWAASMQIRSLALSLQCLLGSPNPDDPLDYTIAEEWKTNKALAISKAKEFTKKHAMR